MNNAVFAAAVGVAQPWFVKGTDFDAAKRTLSVVIDFEPGSRFPHPDVAGVHPVYDTQTRRYRHLNLFQHECYLDVRSPRVKLPDGRVLLIDPPWAGKALRLHLAVRGTGRASPAPQVACRSALLLGQKP